MVKVDGWDLDNFAGRNFRGFRGSTFLGNFAERYFRVIREWTVLESGPLYDMREADILLSIEIPQLSILICSTLSNLMNGSA